MTGYYFIYVFVKLLSLLPFRVLYLISDLLFFLLYRLIGYRKKVVRQNLKNSFPEKPAEELLVIEVKFFRHLCDLIVEVVKLYGISKEELTRHCVVRSDTKTLLSTLFSEKKSLCIITSHCGNWEWCGSAFSLQCSYELTVPYRPVASKSFNRIMYELRTRFGNRIIPVNDTLREALAKQKDITATGYIADQTPLPDRAYWTTFMNQETPVFPGPEKIARKFRQTVLFFHIRKIKRGFYEIFAEVISENPSDAPEHELTEKYTEILENDIRQQPEIWLWSHKRWKHRRKL